MQFIEALKLRSKLFFLFILITIGLITIGIMGAVHINSMKKSVDSLYFGSLVPVTELNEILQIYHGKVLNTFYNVKSDEISLEQAQTQIQTSITNINMYWKDYESHFKRDEELEYVEYVGLEIDNANQHLISIFQQNRDLKDLNIDSIITYVSQMHLIIKKLIKYEIDVAKYDRKQFLNKYDATLLEVGMILLVIIIAVLFISYHVFASIQKDQTKLEITTKKLKRANKKLENVSYTDALTSLHNRRYFNFIYDKELKRAKRTKCHITFMMLDIDFFKQYNDTYGHIEGDFALKSVAKVLKDTLKRPSDFVFRLGGEEFGILLTDTDELDSAKLAQDICDAIRGREIKHETSKAGEFITISIGVVCCVADEALDDDVLLSLADKMLYKAKESGRDCFCLSTDVSLAKIIERASA